MNQGLPPYKYKRIIRELREIIKTKDQIIRNISKDKETVKDIETKLRREYDNRRLLDKRIIQSMQHKNTSLYSQNFGLEKKIKDIKKANTLREESANNRIDSMKGLVIEAQKRVEELENRTLIDRILNKK